MISGDDVAYTACNVTQAATADQTVVTVTMNGIKYYAVAKVLVCDGTTSITLSAHDLRQDVLYDVMLPPRSPDIDLPQYEVPAWLREQRRVPKQKRRVPSFKPGPHRSHRRGAY